MSSDAYRPPYPRPTVRWSTAPVELLMIRPGRSMNLRDGRAGTPDTRVPAGRAPPPGTGMALAPPDDPAGTDPACRRGVGLWAGARLRTGAQCRGRRADRRR